MALETNEHATKSGLALQDRVQTEEELSKLYVVVGRRKLRELKRWASENGLKVKGKVISPGLHIGHPEVEQVVKLAIKRPKKVSGLEISYKPIKAVGKRALIDGEEVVGFVLWWNKDMTLVWPYIPRRNLNDVLVPCWFTLYENSLE